MKILKLIVFLLPTALQLALPFWLISDFGQFRSQNALYHARLAQLYVDQTDLKTLGVLAHSEMAGSFVDQHKNFHLLLAAFRGLGDEVALLVVAVLGLALVTLTLSHTFRHAPVAARLILPLLIPWGLSLASGRWISTRPGIWFVFFFLLILLQLKPFKGGRMPLRSLFTMMGAAFIWSGLSLTAWISLPCVAVYGAINATKRQNAILLTGLGLALGLGTFWAMGMDSVWFAVAQIWRHALQPSGISEWQAPGRLGFSNLLPLVVHLALAVLLLLASPLRLAEFLRSHVDFSFRWALGLSFAILSLLQQRWIEFAWLMTVLNLGLSLTTPAARVFAENLPPWRWATATLLGSILLCLQLNAFKHSSQRDGSLNPLLPSFLSEVNRRHPQGQALLTLDWTAWSTAFYADPMTRMEPGFSLGLYSRNSQFLKDFLSLDRASDENRLDILSRMLETLDTDLVIGRDEHFRPFQHEAWFSTIYEVGGWKLGRISLSRTPAPEDLRATFDGVETLLKVCARNPLAIQWEDEKPYFSGSAADCEMQIKKLAADRKNDEGLIRIYLDPKKLRTIHQIESPRSRGFFTLYDPLSRGFRVSAEGNTNLWSVREIRGRLRTAEEVGDGRSTYGRRYGFQNPSPRQICDAYQSLAGQILRHSPEVFAQLDRDAKMSEGLRAQLGLATLCMRPNFIAQKDRLEFAGLCRRFKERLAENLQETADDFKNQRGGGWSARLLTDWLAIPFDLPRALPAEIRDKIFSYGRINSHSLATDLGEQGFRTNVGEAFASGHFAVWWTGAWEKAPPSPSERKAFDDFARRYEKLWRGPLGYNSFMIRWWSEALVNAYAASPSAQTSFWMEQFFRATETFMEGPTLEYAPECPGPRPPGIALFEYPNHNAGLLLEGLEQARRVKFPWWSDREDRLLRRLLSCTLSLQKSAAFWPKEEVGELAWSTAGGPYRVDTQAHALNALGLRLENDGVTCLE